MTEKATTMNNESQVVNLPSIVKTFEKELARKRSEGLFCVPAKWVDLRWYSKERGFNEIVNYYDETGTCITEKLSFSDPFAPFGVESGTIISFPENSEKSRQLEKVKLSTRRSVERNEEFFYKNGGWWTAGVSSAIVFPLTILSADPSPEVGPVELFMALTAFSILFSLSFMMGIMFLNTGLNHFFPSISVISDNARLERKKTAAEIAKNSFNQTDEVYLLGPKARVHEIFEVETSEETAALVQEKLRSNPTGTELLSWTETVLEILELRKFFNKEAFPLDLIPMMTEDAVVIRERLQDRVNEVRAEWVEAQRDEALAIEHGLSMSANHETVAMTSKTTRAGAESLLSQLSINDVNKTMKVLS